jgi:hypothetical protein
MFLLKAEQLELVTCELSRYRQQVTVCFNVAARNCFQILDLGDLLEKQHTDSEHRESQLMARLIEAEVAELDL